MPKSIRDRIIEECKKSEVIKSEQIQYVVATVEHETNGTFKPVKEAYYLGEKLGERYRKTKRYYPYYGRGFSQITWKQNYKKFSKILDIDLVNNPDLALDFQVSLKILIYGMKHGIFTGRKLDDYFSHKGSDFVGARKIINGKDKAQKIALMAQKIKVA